jgi:hypothetical protein
MMENDCYAYDFKLRNELVYMHGGPQPRTQDLSLGGPIHEADIKTTSTREDLCLEARAPSVGDLLRAFLDVGFPLNMIRLI